MPALDYAIEIKDEIASYRQALHKHPQTAYEETYASDFVQKKLTEWGVPFQAGLAKTGVVATIEGKTNISNKSIGLRADLDALNINEETGLPYCSVNKGKMHACGHDGHTAILLGVAKYLSQHAHFDGKVHLIFQPAEEGEKGADTMIEEGLFKQFPCDQVFGLHNWPWLPLGQISMRVGAIMASVDEFSITLTGKAGHAAVPQSFDDPIVVAAQMITAFQTIVARDVDPMIPAVVSVTNLNAGTGAFNISPQTAEIVGTVRALSKETQQLIEERMHEIATNIANAFNLGINFNYNRVSIATINTVDEVALSADAARDIVGEENVDTNVTPFMTGEDFGAMLEQVPGTYVYMGQANPHDSKAHTSHALHHANYDFNDEAIPVGISYMVRLVERALPLKK